MKRFIIGLLIVGGAIAAIALVVRKRAGSRGDEWDAFAEDTFVRASDAASTVADAAKDATSKVRDSAKGTASKVSDTAKDAASKVTDTAKDAASKVTDAAKDA
jgi:gas vesicle protein